MSKLEPIETHSAHWGWDEHQYFGHAVFSTLLGHESLTGLLALSVLGRRLDAAELAVLDDAAVASTMADPRIWPLKLTRTLSSYGSSIRALAGGLAVQEGARIGPWAVQKAADVLIRWRASLGTALDRESIEAVVMDYLSEHRIVWGFGTPFRGKDERLVAFERRVRHHQRHSLPFWTLFETAAAVVVRERGAQPNMGMALAAVFLDLGAKPEQVGPLTTALMSHMFLAHGVEGAQKPSAALRCLPDSAVQYTGPSQRKSPRCT
jgi:hypothetical protein